MQNFLWKKKELTEQNLKLYFEKEGEAVSLDKENVVSEEVEVEPGQF